jgi:hypothetical protein
LLFSQAKALEVRSESGIGEVGGLPAERDGNNAERMANIIQTIDQRKELVTIDLKWLAVRKNGGLHLTSPGKRNNRSFILSLLSADISIRIVRRELEK